MDSVSSPSDEREKGREVVLISQRHLIIDKGGKLGDRSNDYRKRACVRACVCVTERDREADRDKDSESYRVG